MIDRTSGYDGDWIMVPLLGPDEPFTKSNGTVMARVYERLTKASRRREAVDPQYDGPMAEPEYAYRKAVYDTLAALQQELV